MQKYLAECIGTFALVLIGCGTAVIAGDEVGILGIAFAFGLTLLGMVYMIGPISGCHINPAVSLAMYTSGQLGSRDLVLYILAQCLGGIIAAGLLWMMVSGKLDGYDLTTNGLGQNGWGINYAGEFSRTSALVFEFIATMLFVMVILGATEPRAPKELAGVAIGFALVFVNLMGINITGASVNPARSLGPALLVGGQALAQVWLFLLVPSIAGIVGGLVWKQLFHPALSLKKPLRPKKAA